MKGGSTVESPLGGSEHDLVGRLDDAGGCKQPLNPRKCGRDRFAKARNSMVNLCNVIKSQVFTAAFAESVDDLFCALQRPGKAPARFFNDASLVASEFGQNDSGNYEGDGTVLNKVFKCLNKGPLMMILGEVEPNTCVNEDFERHSLHRLVYD